MVANFKRRVPPRPPKGKRRPEEVGGGAPGQGLQSSSSKGSLGSNKHLPSLSQSIDNTQYGSLQPVIPHSVSSSSDLSLAGGSGMGPQPGSGKWAHQYGRNALPPLSIPGSSSQGDFPSLQQQQQQQAYLHSAGGASAGGGGGGGGRYGNVHPITPTDDVAYATPNVYQPRDHHSHLFGFSSSSGPGGSAGGGVGPPGGGGGGTPNTEVPSPMGFAGVSVSTATPFTTTSAGWTPSPFEAHSSHHPYHPSSGGGPQLPPLNTQSGPGSLSALLNHNNSSARSPPQHHLASSYPSPYGAVPPHGGLSRGGGGGAGGGGDSPTATSASVSRPTTGYSSVSSGGGGSGGGGGYHQSHSHSHSAGGHVQQSPIDYQHPAYGQQQHASMGSGGMRRPSSSGGPPPPGSAGSGAIRRVPTREHMGLGAMPYPGSNQRHQQQQHHPSSVLDDEGSTPPLMNFSSPSSINTRTIREKPD